MEWEGHMDKFSTAIIRHRKLILVLFALVSLVCALLYTQVRVNYNVADYLPEHAQSTKAIRLMGQEFTQSIPNAEVMTVGVSVPEALEYKRKLAAIDGVTEVLWLDDAIDLKTPLEMQNAETVESYYKNGNALFSLTIEAGMETPTCRAIRALIGPENALAGDAADREGMQNAASSEVLGAMAILLPIIILLLILSTTSWMEPLLFLAAIGVSVIINMGTNVFVGEISFVTNSISPILQLAVSLDYAIFLLHSFADHRQECEDVEEAMRRAIKDSMSSVAASALTTLFGFLALVFMDFRIGSDLGLCLAKGIVLSFTSVMVFLPALTLTVYKFIVRTQHRVLLPSFRNINRFLSKFAIPVVAFVLLLAVPSFLGQGKTDFIYGFTAEDAGEELGRGSRAVKTEFGDNTIMVLLVPRGDVVKERDLSRALGELPHVTSVISFAQTVGTAIPSAFLDRDITSQFYSEAYARIIVNTDTKKEGDVAFRTVEDIYAVTRAYYGDDFYSTGESATLYDMRSVVGADNVRVNIIAVVAIFLVLVCTFRSAVLPFVLLLTIEVGIWVNLAIPYFTGTSINFIGYLVLNTVQLGATVDYAILLTSTYLRNRRRMPQREAINASLGGSFKSIIVSAAILSSAGFALYFTTSNPVVRDIGELLGRGTLLSLLMVVCFLPTMLALLDGPIGKTTWHANFYRPPKQPKGGARPSGGTEKSGAEAPPDETVLADGPSR